MAKHKHAKIGRPTKGEGPKLSTPEEVEANWKLIKAQEKAVARGDVS